MENIILENDKVLLKPLQEEDFTSLLPFSIDEPEIWKYSLITASGVENLKKYIDLALEEREKKTELPFIVIDKKTNQIAGTTRLYNINLQHKTLSLGYTWYGKKFQGTGINKNCKYLLLQYAFEILRIERVEFRADENNQRSIHAMKSIGCYFEGILRSNCETPDGNRRNSVVLSILKNDWYQSVKENLKKKL